VNRWGGRMKFKKLQLDAELLHFREQAYVHIDVLFPLQYLKRSTVVGCFDAAGTLVGGYMLVHTAPFRVLESVPEEQRRGAVEALSCSQWRVGEITGLWIAHRHRGRTLSGRLWLRLYRDMIMSGKTHFVYAYTLRKPNLGAQYAVARPRVLFRGLTKVLPGMGAADEESVEVFSLVNLILAPLRHPEFLGARFRIGRGGLLLWPLRLRRKRAQKALGVPSPSLLIDHP
jgi:hypothetical protein